MGTVTEAVIVRATRMRRSPFSTSISVRSVSARRVASSRTRSGSKGLAFGIDGDLCRKSVLRLCAIEQNGHQRIKAEHIAHEAEAADHPDADRGEQGAMAELL